MVPLSTLSILQTYIFYCFIHTLIGFLHNTSPFFSVSIHNHFHFSISIFSRNQKSSNNFQQSPNLCRTDCLIHIFAPLIRPICSCFKWYQAFNLINSSTQSSSIMPFGLVSAWNKRRRSKSEDLGDPWKYKPAEYWQVKDQNPPSKRHHGSSVFTFKEMEEATNCFSEGNLIGKGGFGRVYKGTLRSGEVVAIKKMELPPFKAAEGEREFRVEVDILSRLDHPNLVSLIGYCADGKHRFLVYEYMRNGNLQDHLNGEVRMEWPIRLRVAIGAARGLAYLHSSSSVGIPIVHRDFKSTNILLSTNFEAKISDFGLAKLMPEGQETHVTARVLGTFGYFDPEYTSTGKLTLQSDVYAFGVVLLELLTGRRAVDLNQGPNDQNLVYQVRNILNDRKKLRKVIDPEMSRNSYTMESIAMVANLASRCVRAESSERPTMEECVKELQVILYTNSKGLGMAMHTFRMV